MGRGERQLQSKQQHLIATFYTTQILNQLSYEMKTIFYIRLPVNIYERKN